jgi:hypothetical protein
MRGALFVVLGLLGCSGQKDTKDTCAAGFIGDPNQPPQVTMIYTDGISQELSDVTPNQAIPLEPPPQGGYVMYLAARIRNMDACVEFRGSLNDPDNGNQVGFDARGSTVVQRGDGWGWPDPTSNSNLSNVNGCPDYSPKDVQGQRYTLQMTVTDREGRTAQVEQPIMPACTLADSTTQADCICICSANYVLGKCASLP